MSYHRKAMPLPSSEPYEKLSIFQNSNLQRPPLPPRRDSRTAPPLPPRVKDQDFENIEIKSTAQKFSVLNMGGEERIVDFDNVLKADRPPSVFPECQHVLNPPPCVNNDRKPIETNKFYGNMLVGNQTNPIWTHPYSLWWSKDSPHTGIAVAHVKESQRVFGPGSPPQYFFNPVGIKSFVFSSDENCSPDNFSLGLSSLRHMSAQLFLMKNSNQYIRLPLVQGMGFVTAIYHGLIPKLHSAVGFRNVQKTSLSNGQDRYEILLENDVIWLLYVTKPNNEGFNLSLRDSNTLVGSQVVNNYVFQIVASNTPAIDTAAGCYPIDCNVKCSVNNDRAVYSFNYLTEGNSTSGKTFMFTFPHHFNNFSEAYSSQKFMCQLDSTIKGLMNAYVTDAFEMNIEIPNKLQFLPFTTIPGKNNDAEYTNEVLSVIKRAAASEVNADLLNESNLDSMYFSGKILAKYAWILFCCHHIIHDEDLVSVLLPKLKTAMNRFISNTQILPLNYDKIWGGLISSGTSSQDFGNSFYNDHHFHYSYHVIAAAIIAMVDRDVGDKNWLQQNQVWVETLIRDYANPSENDDYFPQFRSFDWFNGHSFAKGLFESGDGKDQESSSEDVNASYALKLWGLVTANQTLVDIADIQLGILKTSINLYFLYEDDNKVMPAEFIANKVSGILFENKIDHTTYFGNELQYIQMIHAIPITPASSFIRSPKFVEEEWQQKLSPIVKDIQDGWKGIIMLNVALFNPQMSFDYFNSTEVYLDNGQSLTWSLAYSGAFL